MGIDLLQSSRSGEWGNPLVEARFKEAEIRAKIEKEKEKEKEKTSEKSREEAPIDVETAAKQTPQDQ